MHPSHHKMGTEAESKAYCVSQDWRPPSAVIVANIACKFGEDFKRQTRLRDEEAHITTLWGRKGCERSRDRAQVERSMPRTARQSVSSFFKATATSRDGHQSHMELHSPQGRVPGGMVTGGLCMSTAGCGSLATEKWKPVRHCQAHINCQASIIGGRGKGRSPKALTTKNKQRAPKKSTHTGGTKRPLRRPCPTWLLPRAVRQVETQKGTEVPAHT